MGPKQEVSTPIEDKLGLKCTFDNECAWTWNTSNSDAFHIVTGANLTETNITGMMPGPAADAKDDANGKCFCLFVFFSLLSHCNICFLSLFNFWSKFFSILISCIKNDLFFQMILFLLFFHI